MDTTNHGHRSHGLGCGVITGSTFFPKIEIRAPLNSGTGCPGNGLTPGDIVRFPRQIQSPSRSSRTGLNLHRAKRPVFALYHSPAV